ncbi:hypothetical protein V6N12_046656 [Hibiscus sabdariffa]|uniref:RNase H type-1 domain-containing protein n=1 Tax=Hibiscus sabdariffa TaxID=183260 RepID=A0ABR1ZQY7_9ROSI
MRKRDAEIQIGECLNVQLEETLKAGCSSLVLHFQEIQHRPWIVCLQHVRREGNTILDMLSKTTMRNDFDVRYFDAPIAMLIALMHADISSKPVR